MHITNFNQSIWHVLWILIPLGAVAFMVAFCTVKRGHYYFFDPKHSQSDQSNSPGDFGPHCQRYQDLSKLIVALSAGAIAFLVNTLASQKFPATEFIKRVTEVAPIVVGFFGAAIALAIFFMVLQTTWYEEYCHSSKHNSYKAWKYATCNCLGWSALSAFLLGFIWLARNLFA